MSLTTAIGHTASLLLTLPFDIARDNYARAVRYGFLPSSLLKSALFERELGHMERLTLGPWARRV